MSLPRGAVSWPAVCDCSISCSYLLTFFCKLKQDVLQCSSAYPDAMPRSSWSSLLLQNGFPGYKRLKSPSKILQSYHVDQFLSKLLCTTKSSLLRPRFRPRREKTRLQGYTTFSMLNSAKHENYPAHKMLKYQQLLAL